MDHTVLPANYTMPAFPMYTAVLLELQCNYLTKICCHYWFAL